MKTQARVPARETLTAGPVAVVPEVPVLALLGHPGLLPHLVDLRHAELGVELEEEAAGADRQVVRGPVPQELQVLVVDGRERVHPGGTDGRTEGGTERRTEGSFMLLSSVCLCCSVFCLWRVTYCPTMCTLWTTNVTRMWEVAMEQLNGRKTHFRCV